MSSLSVLLACPKTTGSIAVTRSSPFSALTISPDGLSEEVAKAQSLLQGSWTWHKYYPTSQEAISTPFTTRTMRMKMTKPPMR